MIRTRGRGNVPIRSAFPFQGSSNFCTRWIYNPWISTPRGSIRQYRHARCSSRAAAYVHAHAYSYCAHVGATTRGLAYEFSIKPRKFPRRIVFGPRLSGEDSLTISGEEKVGVTFLSLSLFLQSRSMRKQLEGCSATGVDHQGADHRIYLSRFRCSRPDKWSIRKF